MNLTQDDSGRRLTVRVGETVTVVLAENPTTGYRWHPDVDLTKLEQLDDRYDGQAQPRGAPGFRRLTFRPSQSGPVRLRVVLQRSWEHTHIGEFDVDLDVTQA